MLRYLYYCLVGYNRRRRQRTGPHQRLPDPDVPEARVDLAELVKAREAQGQRLPALFCFPQILQHRLRSISAAFKRA
ncbi:hypothetical protein MJ579_24095 [Klebsiella pneumoniae]|nr:hypothetical protein MJ579_24095 [Klebsiella pneumoniae]